MSSQTFLKQPLFPISIASELLNVHPRTLISYERYGFISPQRTTTARRRYTMEDLKKASFIHYLTQKNINITGIKQVLRLLGELEKQQPHARKTLFPDFKEKQLEEKIFGES